MTPRPRSNLTAVTQIKARQQDSSRKERKGEEREGKKQENAQAQLTDVSFRICRKPPPLSLQSEESYEALLKLAFSPLWTNEWIGEWVDEFQRE